MFVFCPYVKAIAQNSILTFLLVHRTLSYNFMNIQVIAYQILSTDDANYSSIPLYCHKTFAVVTFVVVKCQMKGIQYKRRNKL